MQTKRISIPDIPVIDVSIVPSLSPQVEPKTSQIVSPSEVESDIQPKDTSQLSEKNVTVPKEQIKRGQQDAAPKIASKPMPQKPQSKPKQAVIKSESSPSLKTFSLDTATMLSKFSNESPREKNELSPTNYKAFSRPSGSGARFVGLQGSSDFLPHLPDGDITLLNAKASKFAVFVRRVALQVFSEIRLQGWDFLSAGDIRTIRDFSTIRAIMNPAGKLIKIVLEGPSGSVRFDEVITKAAKSGTRDPNPPAEAKASDGNYHFIFKAKSWVRSGNEPRHGLPVEYRWLLLSTGLE